MPQHENRLRCRTIRRVPAVGFSVFHRAHRPAAAVVRGVRLALFVVAEMALGRTLDHGRDGFLFRMPDCSKRSTAEPNRHEVRRRGDPAAERVEALDRPGAVRPTDFRADGVAGDGDPEEVANGIIFHLVFGAVAERGFCRGASTRCRAA